MTFREWRERVFWRAECDKLRLPFLVPLWIVLIVVPNLLSEALRHVFYRQDRR